MKVAIIHDWLTQMGGAERVLNEILSLFPQGDLFTIVDHLPAQSRKWLNGHRITTSFIQKLPFSRSRYRSYLPLMPIAVEQFDLRGYDLIISSSHAVAKGVITGPDQIHIGYIHSPMRYAWDMQHAYLERNKEGRGFRNALTRLILHYLRQWDSISSTRIDHVIANSSFVAGRIAKAYRREAHVIYPPVDTDFYTPAPISREEYYFTACRHVPYKRIDLILETFRKRPDRYLVIAGNGPQTTQLKALAPSNVEFVGHCDETTLRQHLRRARAFLYAAEEDFGIALVEALACGCPVIAYGRGGASEIINDLSSAYPTGILYPHQTSESLLNAINQFEKNQYIFSPSNCRRRAEDFSRQIFRERFMQTVNHQIALKQAA